MLHKIKHYTLIIGTTSAIAVPYGQYWHPIPLEPRTALPSYSGDALPNLDFTDNGFEIGYSDEYRNDMNRLVSSVVKPKRKPKN